MLLALLVVTPLFLGETKAVVILLPLMFLVLYRRVMITKPHYGVAGLLLGALLTAGSGYVYLSFSEKKVDDQIRDYLDYNVYKKGYGHNYLNRTTVLTFWAEKQGAHDPVSLVLGNGLGSSHTFAGGHVAMRYPNHGIGLTAASSSTMGRRYIRSRPVCHDLCLGLENGGPVATENRRSPHSG